ncbi:hypothetical protein OF83DRAFT_1158461 [Amylostereum chailletii]|nr:hypothetical protein OF83DRAFT_1158461 [Amylostereum chailletii]
MRRGLISFHVLAPARRSHHHRTIRSFYHLLFSVLVPLRASARLLPTLPLRARVHDHFSVLAPVRTGRGSTGARGLFTSSFSSAFLWRWGAVGVRGNVNTRLEAFEVRFDRGGGELRRGIAWEIS